jgi:hypothetical protein
MEVLLVDTEIVVVSGLPRSGTSLMMQMIHAGGVPALTDHIRAADTDNPRGYYEFERVKKVKDDCAWLPDARGRVVKMVSQLLYDLPGTERYRIVFMERDLDEVLDSQEKMLIRLGRPVAPRAEIARAFGMHLNRLHRWLAEQPNFTVLRIRYADVVAHPQEQAARVSAFLGSRLDVATACTVVDPSLYRNKAERKPATSPVIAPDQNPAPGPVSG